jgi:di/tricarboxylate transporter
VAISLARLILMLPLAPIAAQVVPHIDERDRGHGAARCGGREAAPDRTLLQALFGLVLLVALVVSGLVPNVQTALIACLPVVGPGNYQFGDFVKVGVPFSVVVMIVSALSVPGCYTPLVRPCDDSPPGAFRPPKGSCR